MPWGTPWYAIVVEDHRPSQRRGPVSHTQGAVAQGLRTVKEA